MKEESSKQEVITVKDLQKEIYSFLTSKNKPFLSLPRFLQKESNLRIIITIKYVFPLIAQVQVQPKSKELLIKLLLQVLANPQQSIKAITQFFSNSNQEDHEIGSQIRNQTTITAILSKVISLPTYLINLLNDPKLNFTAISLKEIQLQKSGLYYHIIAGISLLPIEEKIIIINKLIILKEEQVVIDFYIHKNQEFIVQNFTNFSKQTNIIKYLYKKYIMLGQCQQKLIIERILTSIANSYPSSTSCFMALLNLNETFYYSSERYKNFYNVLFQTNQKEQLTKQLLLWWAVSKNYIVTTIQAKVRCNLLGIIIENISKQELYQNNYLVSITQGIKKRLTDGSSKHFASFIWKMLGKKLEIKLTDEIERSDYFIIQDEIVEDKNISNDKLTPKRPQKSMVSCQKTQSLEQRQSDEEQIQPQTQQQGDIIKIEPKNIYDCILALRNPHRKEIALKKLPEIIKRYKQDLALMWNTLLRQLLSPVRQQYISILVQLFILKSEDFIEAVFMFFMSRQNNISQKTYLIQVLKLGIDELSTTHQEQEEEDDQSFYFKKVKSKYYKESEKNSLTASEVEEKESRTRRWGHTRIAHEKASKPISLNFIKKESSINRFYPIANLLYFRIIDPMSANIIQNLRAHQVYVHSLLKLIAVFISNIKNHFDKYIIISDSSSLCSKIVLELKQNSKKTIDRYEQTGGLTLMLTLQILNKISLVVDHYITENIMENLKQCIEGSRQLPNYGMSSVIDMIQANIYHRVFQKNQ